MGKITVMDTLSETMTQNKREGYTADFKLQEDGLRCLDNDRVYRPEQMQIVAHHRFEGTSNPDDMAAIYLVETEDGVKGLIVDAFSIATGQSFRLAGREIANPNAAPARPPVA